MSFIYENPWLLQELLKSAQATPAPAPAPAPQANKPANAVTEEGAKALEYAKQLVQNLYKELAGGFTFTAERENADLSGAHVVNVDEFLYFLQFNGVKANGYILVMKANEFLDQNGKLKPNMTELAKWYVPYPVQGNPTYYLYKDGMLGFLKEMEEKAANNPILQAVLVRLKATLSTALPEKTTPKTDVAGDSSTPQVNPQQQQGQQGQAGSISPQALQQLAALRPFRTESIDFREIKLFLDRYAQLVPNVKPLVDQVKNSMNIANRLMNTNDVPIQLGNMTSAVVKTWTTQPIPLLNTLYTIIRDSGRVYQDFFNQFKAILGDEAARPVEQQITSGGPQQSNLTDIMDVRSTMMNEIQTGGRR